MESLIRLKSNKNAIFGLNVPSNELPSSLLEKFVVIPEDEWDEYENSKYLLITPEGKLSGGAVPGASALAKALSEDLDVLSRAGREVDDPSFFGEDRLFTITTYRHTKSNSSVGLERRDEVQAQWEELGLHELDGAKITYSEATKQVHISISGDLPSFATNGSSETILNLLSDPEIENALVEVREHMGAVEEALASANAWLKARREEAAAK